MIRLTLIIPALVALLVSGPAWAFEQVSVKKLLAMNACIKCDLSGSKLNNSNLRGAKLIGANLAKANLYSADLNFADLSGASLSGASLTKANLTDVDLTKTTLGSTKLTGAILCRTKVPWGIESSGC